MGYDDMAETIAIQTRFLEEVKHKIAEMYVSDVSLPSTDIDSIEILLRSMVSCCSLQSRERSCGTLAALTNSELIQA